MASDNEYHQGDYGAPEYYQELEDTFRKNGIVVPLTYNDADLEGNFINGTVRIFNLPLLQGLP